jgi:hypothetical protein
MKLVTTTTDTLQANQHLGVSGVSTIHIDNWGNISCRCESGASLTLYSSERAVAEAVSAYLTSLRHCSGERATESLKILETFQERLTESRSLLRDRETV